MWLPSRLERSTLGDLLGSLHRGRVSGRLDLIGDARASIHFDAGVVVRIDGGGARLGERIARTWSERQRIDQALDDAEGSGDLAGAELQRRGLATAGEVRAALEAQGRERLERLYGVRRADLRFHVARGDARGVPMTLGPATFLHGRPRATPRTERCDVAPIDPLRSALDALGLPPSPLPTRDAIRRAFRVRAASLHPDRARDDRARAVMGRAFTDLAGAYERALAAVDS